MPRHLHILCCLVLLTAAFVRPETAAGQTEFRRDLEQISFVPKGQWITGLSVSYSQTDMDNYQFLIIENMTGDTYNFKLSPMLFYAFGDNLAAGGRFAYERSRARLDAVDLVLDSETSYSGGPLYAISHSYYGTTAFRNYISLGRSMRFGFFNEVQLQIGGGQSKIVNGEGLDLTGTYARNFGISLGLTPGVIMFLNNYSALEVSVGVLGFNYRNTRSVTDQIYVANTDVKSANFKINLFSISFGVAFYL